MSGTQGPPFRGSGSLSTPCRSIVTGVVPSVHWRCHTYDVLNRGGSRSFVSSVVLWILLGSRTGSGSERTFVQRGRGRGVVSPRVGSGIDQNTMTRGACTVHVWSTRNEPRGHRGRDREKISLVYRLECINRCCHACENRETLPISNNRVALGRVEANPHGLFIENAKDFTPCAGHVHLAVAFDC